MSHRVAGTLLAKLVLAIRWADGEWTVRGQIAIWLNGKLAPVAEKERRRNRE